MGAVAALFFARGHLQQGLHTQWAAMVQEIHATPEEHVLQADEQAWAAALYERYRVEPPFLVRNEVWMEEPEEVQVDVSSDASRLVRMRPALVPGHTVWVHVPFTGEGDVFHFLPSSHVMVELYATVGDQELIKEITYPDDRLPNITAETEQFIGRVETNLGSARADISRYDSRLEQGALDAIRGRREAVRRHRAHIESTGLPIGSPQDRARRRVTEVITRLPAPVLPTSSPDRPPVTLEPVLLDETYEHILGVIREHAREMSRNPATYQDMGEEDRRFVILNALNPHYRGIGTAEAFNHGGKTDIYLAHEGRSLFVAECKIWTGPQGFGETIDQLFRYQTWLDTKLAILMFVDRRDLSAVIDKAREVLSGHAQFVRWEDSPAETELRATVVWEGDEQRHADLAVLFFHLPAPRAAVS